MCRVCGRTDLAEIECAVATLHADANGGKAYGSIRVEQAGVSGRDTKMVNVALILPS